MLNCFITMPVTAPAHTVASMTTLQAPLNASRHNGVYVPAIRTKIIEWSRRFIRFRAGSDHATR